MNLTLRLAILTSPVRSQIKLAAQTGIGEGRLSRIVNGWVDPTEQQRQAIAEALGRPVAELFGAQRTEVRSGGAAR